MMLVTEKATMMIDVKGCGYKYHNNANANDNFWKWVKSSDNNNANNYDKK